MLTHIHIKETLNAWYNPLFQGLVCIPVITESVQRSFSTVAIVMMEDDGNDNNDNENYTDVCHKAAVLFLGGKGIANGEGRGKVQK